MIKIRVLWRLLLQFCIGLSDIMTSEDKRGASHSENWGREAEVSENGEQQIKGPKVRVCIQCLTKSKEACVAGEQWARNRMEIGKVREAKEW